MRTTVQFDKDTSAAISQFRQETGLGVSEAINHLVRRGLMNFPKAVPFNQPTHPLGLKIDVSNVAEALERLEGPSFG